MTDQQHRQFVALLSLMEALLLAVTAVVLKVIYPNPEEFFRNFFLFGFGVILATLGVNLGLLRQFCWEWLVWFWTDNRAWEERRRS